MSEVGISNRGDKSWRSTSAGEWTRDQGRGVVLRVRRLTRPGGRGETYLAYSGSVYLGREPTLDAAQARADSGERRFVPPPPVR